MPQTLREAKSYRSMLFVVGHKLDGMLKALEPPMRQQRSGNSCVYV